MKILLSSRLVVVGLLLSAVILAAVAWSESRSSKVIVEWETASELNTAGFQVYRGENRGNITSRLNSSLLPPSSDPLRGKAYQFTDETAMPGKTYFYLVEEVELSGTTQQFGPIEVYARGGGRVEAVLAASLGVLGFAGLVYWIMVVRQKPG